MNLQLFSKVLIANRGEIAIRIAKTLHNLGIRSVAVYSKADQDAAHVRFAQQAVLLGETSADSYLNPQAVVQAAVDTGAEAIHPGYGFISENVELARACKRAGITFIGPNEHALEVMRDKIRSKNHVAKAGVRMVDGVSEPDPGDTQLIEATKNMTFPMLIKPSAGGGGTVMHVRACHVERAGQSERGRRNAGAAAGDDPLVLEQRARAPGHGAVEDAAASQGNVIDRGERGGCLQGGHQESNAGAAR